MSVAVPVAQATEASSIDFSGELDYETFARAASQGTSVRIRRSPGGTGAAAMALGRTRGLVIDGALPYPLQFATSPGALATVGN